MKKTGISLMEVLIALAIMSVIAAMTIPKYLTYVEKDLHRNAVYKDLISILSQVTFDGTINATIKKNDSYRFYTTHIQTLRKCPVNSTSGGANSCWATTTPCPSGFTSLGETCSSPGFIARGGASVVGFDNDGNKSSAGSARGERILVDWNGSGKPNVLGDDQMIIVLSFGDGTASYSSQTSNSMTLAASSRIDSGYIHSAYQTQKLLASVVSDIRNENGYIVWGGAPLPLVSEEAATLGENPVLALSGTSSNSIYGVKAGAAAPDPKDLNSIKLFCHMFGGNNCETLLTGEDVDAELISSLMGSNGTGDSGDDVNPFGLFTFWGGGRREDEFGVLTDINGNPIIPPPDDTSVDTPPVDVGGPSPVGSPPSCGTGYYDLETDSCGYDSPTPTPTPTPTPGPTPTPTPGPSPTPTPAPTPSPSCGSGYHWDDLYLDCVLNLTPSPTPEPSPSPAPEPSPSPTPEPSPSPAPEPSPSPAPEPSPSPAPEPSPSPAPTPTPSGDGYCTDGSVTVPAPCPSGFYPISQSGGMGLFVLIGARALVRRRRPKLTDEES